MQLKTVTAKRKTEQTWVFERNHKHYIQAIVFSLHVLRSVIATLCSSHDAALMSNLQVLEIIAPAFSAEI